MARAIGVGSSQFMGARVAGRDGTPSVTYIPAHTKNGKPINQRCIIPVYINSNKGTDRDGTPGRSDRFRLVAWGKLADICARSLPKGKALDCVCTPHSYEGRIYDAQGNMRVDNTGQPITVERVGFTIEKIVFGEESIKEIAQEIATGKRPQNWNIPNHSDYQTWISILQTRQNTQYTGGATFGFARVIVPSGPGIALMTGQPATGNAGYNQPPAGQGYNQPPVNQAGVNTQNPAVDQNQLVQMIAEVLNAQQANAGAGQQPPPAEQDSSQNVQQGVF